MTPTRRSHDSAPGYTRSRWFIGFLLFAAVSIYMLFTEHRAHFFSALPLVLLAVCVIAHTWMHRHDAAEAHHNSSEQGDGDRS